MNFASEIRRNWHMESQMPWINGQTKPMVKAISTGPKNRNPQRLVAFVTELLLVIFLFFMVSTPDFRLKRRGG
jgi:hypothetical protein